MCVQVIRTGNVLSIPINDNIRMQLPFSEIKDQSRLRISLDGKSTLVLKQDVNRSLGTSYWKSVLKQSPSDIGFAFFRISGGKYYIDIHTSIFTGNGQCEGAFCSILPGAYQTFMLKFSLPISFNIEMIKSQFIIEVKSNTAQILVPGEKFFPGQLKYSKRDVEEDKEPKVGNLENQKVIKSPYGYVLIDGHHHFIAYKNVKGMPKEIPVEIIEVMDDMSETEFWDKAAGKYVWPRDLQGIATKLPKKNWNLEDDDNLYFAKKSKGHYKAKKGKVIAECDFPIWIKVEEDVPFIEMVIAEALRSGDGPHIFDPHQSDTYESARSKLKKIQDSQWAKDRKIKNLRLLYPPISKDKISQEIMSSWVTGFEQYKQSMQNSI